MLDPKVHTLIGILKTINPAAGLIADLATTAFSGLLTSHTDSKEVLKIEEWISKRSIHLLDRLISENQKVSPSQARIQELEIRLHETLGILLDLPRERPWDG
jgi:hypothetical protein